jgi:Arc/MetJ family transcription regulator
MPAYRQWRVNFTLPGQVLQQIVVQATDVNAARKIVQSMFPRAVIGYIEQV